jgi:hypothetical protein
MLNRHRLGILAGVLACCATRGMAQDAAAEAQNKLLAKRAAEADAYRKLAETIKGVQINSNTYVRDFVTESDEIRADLDTFIKGVRLGKPTWYEDGTCEVPAEVTVQQLITQLKEFHTRHYHGDRVKGTDFENIKQYYKKDIIQVVGNGAPRPDLPPDLPEGVEGVIEQVAVSSAPPPIPDIWKQVPPNERLMAQRAARLDALRKLGERILGLRLNSTTLVRDFVTESDEIRTEFLGKIQGAQEKGRPYYHHDELIVDQTMEIPVESIITTIKELHTRHYKGDQVKGTDIEQIRQTIKTQVFEATGSGVPKPQVVERVIKSGGITMPDWSLKPISATGECTDPAIDTPQGKLKAARCAELDAKRKLAEQIDGLLIESQTTVKDFITQRDEIRAQMQSILVGAVIENTDFTGETARVTVSISGADVWEVVHAEWKVIKRRK